MSLCFWPSFCCGSSFISRNGRRSSTWPFSESWVLRRGGRICSPCNSAGCWALCEAGMLQERGEENSLDKMKKCCVQTSLMLRKALHAGVEEIKELFGLEKCSVWYFWWIQNASVDNKITSSETLAQICVYCVTPLQSSWVTAGENLACCLHRFNALWTILFIVFKIILCTEMLWNPRC